MGRVAGVEIMRVDRKLPRLVDPRAVRWPAGVLLACFIGAQACGGFVESGNGVAHLTVDERGGSLSIDSLSLTIPPEALQMNVTLSARRATIDAPVGPAFVVEPSDVIFNASHAADVGLTYDAIAYPHPPDMFAATLVAGAWHALEVPQGAAILPGVVHGMTLTAGTFGILECTAGVCPGTGIDGGVADGGAHD